MTILINRLLTTLLSTAPIARNTVNFLDSLSLHYEKTKIPILIILFLLTLCTLIKALSSI